MLSQPTEDLDPIRTAVSTAHEEIDEDAPLWESATVGALDTLNDAVINWVNADASRNDAGIEEREQFSAIIAQAKQGNPVDKARTWVEGPTSDVHLFRRLRAIGDQNPPADVSRTQGPS